MAFDNMFDQYNENMGAFYDFTEAVRYPVCTVGFTNTRFLHSICLLPNMHLLVEGGLMDQSVEVYQISEDGGDIFEPIHRMITRCRGLNAILPGKDMIFMGFMMSQSSVNNII